MSSSSLPEHLQETLRSSGVSWTPAIVRWTRYDALDVHLFPDETRGHLVTRIYKGDMVQVCDQFVREGWRLCRTGHMMGWVQNRDVKLLMQSASASPILGSSETDTEPVSLNYQHFEAMYDPEPHYVEPSYAAEETYIPLEPEEVFEVAPPRIEPDRKSLVTRLIGFFKK